MDKPRPAAKDPRVLRTRQLIRSAFVELLQEMEVEKISVGRIAERATINRVTFYLHYKDIPDLMETLADEMTAHIRRLVDEPPAADTEAEEGYKLVRILEHIAQHAEFYKVVLASRRIPVFTERLLSLLSELVLSTLEGKEREALLHKSGMNREIAIWYYSSALIGSIAAWLRSDLPYSPHFLAGQYMKLRAQSY